LGAQITLQEERVKKSLERARAPIKKKVRIIETKNINIQNLRIKNNRYVVFVIYSIFLYLLIYLFIYYLVC